MRHYLHKRIARSIFRSEDLAAHSLLFGGSVAGRIEEFACGQIRGWVYDARRPDQSTKLKLLIDDVFVDEHMTDVYRDDIAALANGNGLNGFEIDLKDYIPPARGSVSVKIVLADNPKYVIGPAVLLLDARTQADGFENFDVPLSLAAHSLRFGGSVAGRIDDFTDGQIRGWVYDARRPDQPTKLKLLIDDVFVDEHMTDVYRDDIAALANGSGLNGFEIGLQDHIPPASGSVTVKIVLADSPDYVLGPAVLMLGARTQADGLENFDVPPSLAAHSLRVGGSVAGRIDDFADGQIRGWVYDARRPDQPTKLKLLIDDVFVDEHMTDVYRDDIAALASNSGLNGFRIDLKGYMPSTSRSITIKIVLADSPEYVLGPAFIISGARSQADGFENFDGWPSLSAEDVSRQFHHLFSHVTATFEDTRSRLEGMQAILSAGPNGLPTPGLPGRTALTLHGHTAPSRLRSTLTGIGSFHSGWIDDKAEEDVMTARIETHLSDARDPIRAA